MTTFVCGCRDLTPLGSGRYSKVFAAKRSDPADSVAIKMFKPDDSDSFANEVKILFTLAKGVLDADNLCLPLSVDAHVRMKDDVPRVHPCIIFPLATMSVRQLITWSKCSRDSPLSISTTKTIMRHVLQGLRHMHCTGIIHADIKPSNLLVYAQTPRPEDFLESVGYTVRICDMGLSSREEKLYSYSAGTDGYMSPEVLVGAAYDCSTDIWSAMCTCYMLMIGEHLFDVHDDHDIDYGEDIRQLFTHYRDELYDNSGHSSSVTMSETSSIGTKSAVYDAIERVHMALIVKLLGPCPPCIARTCRHLFDRTGTLREVALGATLSIEELITRNYEMEDTQREWLCEFIMLGLKYAPEDRKTAGELLDSDLLAL